MKIYKDDIVDEAQKFIGAAIELLYCLKSNKPDVKLAIMYLEALAQEDRDIYEELRWGEAIPCVGNCRDRYVKKGKGKISKKWFHKIKLQDGLRKILVYGYV